VIAGKAHLWLDLICGCSAARQSNCDDDLHVHFCFHSPPFSTAGNYDRESNCFVDGSAKRLLLIDNEGFFAYEENRPVFDGNRKSYHRDVLVGIMESAKKHTNATCMFAPSLVHTLRTVDIAAAIGARFDAELNACGPQQHRPTRLRHLVRRATVALRRRHLRLLAYIDACDAANALNWDAAAAATPLHADAELASLVARVKAGNGPLAADQHAKAERIKRTKAKEIAAERKKRRHADRAAADDHQE
jgi:hypothetical protein